MLLSFPPRYWVKSRFSTRFGAAQFAFLKSFPFTLSLDRNTFKRLLFLLFPSTLSPQSAQAGQKAAIILKEWNGENLISHLISINQPCIWNLDNTLAGTQEKVLLEPFIENFTKNNSNTGWVNSQEPPNSERRKFSDICQVTYKLYMTFELRRVVVTVLLWPRINCFRGVHFTCVFIFLFTFSITFPVYSSFTTPSPQALSHFSYHVSRGELLLCDLQGKFSLRQELGKVKGVSIFKGIVI